MLKVPDWLFISLSIVSVLLLVALAVFLFWCIYVKTRRKRYALSREQQYVLTPASPLMTSPLGYEHPSFIPYTVPTIVQAPRIKPHSSALSPYDLHNPPNRYFSKDHYKPFDVSSSQSEPAIHRTYSTDERFTLRNSPRYSELTQRPASQLNGSVKFYSPASSRASSVRSEHGDPPDSELKRNSSENKEIYLHSSLLHRNSLDQSDFDAKDHVVSYDQEVEEKTQQSNGALYLSLFYDQEASELIITVKQASDLPLTSEKEEDLEVYVNFCIVPEDFYWQKTMSVKQTRHPVFDQMFKIPDVLFHKLRQYTLCFLIMNTGSLQETMLGKVMVPLSDLRAGIALDMCKELGH